MGPQSSHGVIIAPQQSGWILDSVLCVRIQLKILSDDGIDHASPCILIKVKKCIQVCYDGIFVGVTV